MENAEDVSSVNDTFPSRFEDKEVSRRKHLFDLFINAFIHSFIHLVIPFTLTTRFYDDFNLGAEIFIEVIRDVCALGSTGFYRYQWSDSILVGFGQSKTNSCYS